MEGVHPSSSAWVWGGTEEGSVQWAAGAWAWEETTYIDSLSSTEVPLTTLEACPM